MKQQYLARIGYSGDCTPSLAVLRALQRAHLLQVPFENLDIHLGRPIVLGHSYHKVVSLRRGGFCYELNTLFYELLQALGFAVKLISARVWGKNDAFGPEYDHLAIIATVAGRDYLVDVGFGEFAAEPLELVLEVVQPDPRGDFRIVRHQGPYLLVQKRSEGEWEPEYLFTVQARALQEFAEMCRYHQSSPDSPFTQKRVCSRATPAGRVTLTNNRLLTTEHGQVSETVLESEEEVGEVLRRYFGVAL
ncbi:arylamine N-acetyltransferase [Hymenobacter saemangeumensis]